MRIGVVCEGPTDFFAIQYFLGEFLKRKGLNCDFVDIQPELDATQSRAGWGNIERWLTRMAPESRCKRYLCGGLFENDLDAKACDVILVQMDCDHLSDFSFQKFNSTKYGIDLAGVQGIDEEYEAIERVLEQWCGIAQLADRDAGRHAIIPAQQSTESWCIAAFKRANKDPDTLRGQHLINEFMNVLHQSEGRAVNKFRFSEIDKSIQRRRIFCQKHADSCYPNVTSSTSFKKAMGKLELLRKFIV